MQVLWKYDDGKCIKILNPLILISFNSEPLNSTVQFNYEDQYS